VRPLSLQLHVAPDVGFGWPHDGDGAGLLDRFLQALELDDLGQFGWLWLWQ
jgi:hypothetical protein